MNSVNVLLQGVEEVKKFNEIACEYDLTIDVSSGRYCIDGKSILGLFSLDLSKSVKVAFNGDVDEMDKFLTAIQPFVVTK